MAPSSHANLHLPMLQDTGSVPGTPSHFYHFLITLFYFFFPLSFSNKVPFGKKKSGLPFSLNKRVESFVPMQGRLTKGTEHL